MTNSPYEPELPITVSPAFDWPPRPRETLAVTGRSLAAPLLLLYTAIAFVLWNWFTPSLTTMRDLEIGWIALVWVRNLGLLTIWAGGLHYFLYMRRSQNDRFKYNARWLAKDSAKFTARNQVLDNMFWSLGSGVFTWTAYEVLTWWVMANDPDLMRSWSSDTLYLIAMVIAMVFWSQLHFYGAHRLVHVGPLYRWAHALHHRNVNTGPWTGISMHPLEHLVYFSAPVLLWFVPSHPVVVFMLLLYSGISPAASHSGFDKIVLFDRWTLGAGDYFHHLHHRYFEVNYGSRLVPLDVLFRSYHDGTPEAHEQMKARRRS